MASRDAMRRRGIGIIGGAAAAFVAAAAMATGSAVTAAPAKADIDALLDPIIQPLVTSLSDAITGFDPAAATDLTSWTDSLLSGLNSVDFAVPSAAEPAAAVAASSGTGPFDIPLTMQEITEPTVQASIAGSPDQTLLVDTGSSGLVIPWENLGFFNLLSLGFPTGIGESGYSGGVDYLYLTYNDATVNYGDGALTTTNTPIDVEFLSWPTSFSSPPSFEAFLADDKVTGILGLGADTTGPTTSPLASYGGVLVDIPDGKLIVDSANPGTAFATVQGAPIANLYETLTIGSTTTGGTLSNDVDSGGVYGTIASSLVGNAGSVPPGSTIDVYTSHGGTLLYSYTTGTDGLNQSTAPSVVSGNNIDSGVIPFLQEPIYLNYTDNTMSFDVPGSVGK